MRGREDGDPAVNREARHDWWGVVLEAPDGEALARFYSELLGWPLSSVDESGGALAPEGSVVYLATQTCPDYQRPSWPSQPDRQQMMLHLDFEVTDLAAATAHALELGAQLADFQPQDNVRVMLDPAGHPFCLYT